MNLHEEKRLEVAIDRELKALPNLRAPGTLASRVMSAIENGAVLPWYRRAWQTWPVTLRAASLVALLAMFGGLCFAGWELSQAASLVSATQKVGGWFAGLNFAWSAISAVGNALVLVIKSLGTGFIIACTVTALLAYAVSLALGTVFVRLAWARR